MPASDLAKETALVQVRRGAGRSLLLVWRPDETEMVYRVNLDGRGVLTHTHTHTHAHTHTHHTHTHTHTHTDRHTHTLTHARTHTHTTHKLAHTNLTQTHTHAIPCTQASHSEYMARFQLKNKPGSVRMPPFELEMLEGALIVATGGMGVWLGT